MNKTWTKHRFVLIATAAFLLLVCGVSLLLKPALERQELATYQEELLEQIQTGDGTILLDGQLANTPVDYYQTSGDEPVAGDGEDVLLTGIGILSIDAIGLELPVSEGATDAGLKVSACHVTGTAAIGAPGNAVIAGHRSYTHGHLFNRLDELEEGDVITYTNLDGEVIHFAVTGKRVVDPEDQSAFLQPAERRLLTLYTCTPLHTATHRLLVEAERVA